jgi:hypothetical protein
MSKDQIAKLPTFINTRALARLLDRDLRTVQRWIRIKHLPERTSRVDGKKGWPKAVIVKWLRANPEAFADA